MSGSDTSVVHASGIGQLLAYPTVAGPRLSPGKPTGRTVAAIGSSELVAGETTCRYRVSSGIAGKQAGEARWPLASHIGEGKF